MIDRAGADDVLQLAVDRGRVPMAIGALLVVDPGSRPSADAVRSTLLERAATVPRLGQRLVRTPPGAGRPVWVAAGATALAGLVDTVTVERGCPGPSAPARRHGRPRDDPAPHRPPALASPDAAAPDGRVAAIALVAHHVVADGMGGLAVLGALADGDASGGGRRRRRARHPRRPAPLPGWGELARDAWAVAAGRAACARGRRPAPGARRPEAASTSSACGVRGWPSGAACSDAPAPAAGWRSRPPTSPRCGPRPGRTARASTTSSSRPSPARWSSCWRAAASAWPSSSSRCRCRGGPGRGRVAGQRHRGGAGARAGGARCRRRASRRSSPSGRGCASPARGGSAAVLTPAFRGLAAVGAFQAFVDHQRLVHTFVTNVRGPAQRLSLAGAEVIAVVPVAVNPGNVAVSFDVLSYAGALGITLVCDPVLVPESAWLARRVTAGLTAAG